MKTNPIRRGYKAAFALCCLLGLSLGFWQHAAAQEDPEMVKRADLLFRRFVKEPKIRDLHKDALEFAMVNQDRISSLLGRARHAGWLPEFRVRYNYNTDDDRNTAFPTTNSPILTTQRTDLDHRLEVRATWKMDELIFNRNEIQIYRELRRLVELRTDVLKEVTKLYFERRRLQIDLATKPVANFLAYLRQRLRLQELSADLDTLTGGGFSRRMRAAGLNPYK
jgi:hypothetical protein